MCWFSADQADEVLEAKTGERLAIKQMNWHANWVVRESELDHSKPAPVCLIDRTKVLFRFSETEQESLHFGPEAEAVFRMRRIPRQDVFEFSDGRKLSLDKLPAGMIFDILVVPGSEQLSAVLVDRESPDREDEKVR